MEMHAAIKVITSADNTVWIFILPAIFSTLTTTF